ncbi:hypothetical protein PTTG_04073 [Puccinia triticina 1-1 BBBD Race 1]|uniref:tRNA_int_end_N2 domain-containing protein n=2 Tax=Puccinia triticina TaxID=208348 RepID=A0A180GHV0_PUCT1|nr:uncharacterized protein PtA15_3A822 [Puccinia triticina]OAV91533.1 hypothetical protein PTTG_04073 [Puccinia triticina 1-1 BBBD Race 1]WAQ83451.1 hypothetical protein PtA15_3A822 [Puccinia triticina]WAR54289.1 hypothetical protein PtB15_3B803 [Puccinia triticina]
MDRPIEEEDAVEEEAPDWRMLLKYTKSLGAQTAAGNADPFIPRRGEKDFEPTEALAPTQLKALQESRQALFTALSAGVRGHSSRDHVRCVWTSRKRGERYEDEPVVPPYVDGTAKGVLFSSIGRWSRERKRLELSPEELLYLVERGTVECWTAEDRASGQGAVPMTVQHAWAEIMGTSQLSLERYQVYAYLKRLGYIVLRKEHVDSIWRSQTLRTTTSSTYSPRSFLANFLSFTCRPLLKLKCWLKLLWEPNSQSWVGQHISTLAVANRSLIHDGIWKTYESVFNVLSLTPSGPKIRLPTATLAPTTCPARNDGGYEVFYYVYKPNNRFPKSSPPTPDFQVCVIDSEKMCIPDIVSTNTLLDTVQGPSAPLYPPATPKPAADHKLATVRQPSSPFHNKMISLLSFGFFGNQSKSTKKPFRQNVFARLKRGERNVLLAVNDHGIISFLKFTETHFAGTPLVGAQSSI